MRLTMCSKGFFIGVHMNENELLEKILSDAPIAYRADFARIAGSVTAGIMLSQSMYWRGKSTKHADGSFDKTASEWERETAMSEKQQRTARSILESKGLMSFRRGGEHGAMVCKVNLQAVYAALSVHYSECPNGSSAAQTVQTAVPELPKGQTRTAKRPFSPYREYTENTTESTPAVIISTGLRPDIMPNMVRINELIEEFSEDICKVDRTTIDYLLSKAIGKHGVDTIENCLSAILTKTREPGYPSDKIPRNLAKLLNDSGRVAAWAAQYAEKRKIDPTSLPSTSHLSQVDYEGLSYG